jgi:hypothetical protein
MTSSIALLQLPPTPEVPEPLRNRLVIHVRIAYVGPADVGERLIAPLRAIAPTLLDSVAEIPYAAISAIHNDPPAPIPFHDRSILLREFTPATIDTVVRLAGPDAWSPLVLLEVRHLGGALDHRPEPRNAIDTRGSAYLLYAVAVGPIENAFDDYLDELLDALKPWSSGRRFVNFFGAADATTEAVPTGYRPETYQRLVDVKKTYDPQNVFRLNHNIPPA